MDGMQDVDWARARGVVLDAAADWLATSASEDEILELILWSETMGDREVVQLAMDALRLQVIRSRAAVQAMLS